MKRWTCLMMVSALIIPAVLAAKKDVMTSLPDQPVTPDELGPEKYEKFRAPLKVKVNPRAISRETPPMSFTSGTGRYHLNAEGFHSGFEPICFRPKFRAKADDMDRVALNESDLRGFAPGFYDGARVRVYHPIDGKMVKIRDCILPEGGHQAGGWFDARGKVSTQKGDTDFNVKIDDARFQLNRKIWMCVKAVDKFGQWSEASNPVQIIPTEYAGKKAKEDRPAHGVNWKGDAPNKPEPPTAPKNFKVEIVDGIAQCAWSPVDSDTIVGYKLFFSDVDPKNHRGFGFELPHREPHPDQIIQEHDVVFVDRIKTTLTPDDFAGYTIWPPFKISSPFNRVHFDNKYPMWSEGDLYAANWEFVKHPGTLPDDFIAPGETCLKWTTKTDELTGFEMLTYGPKVGWYPPLHPEEWVIEAWVRGEGQARFMFYGPNGVQGEPLPLGVNQTKPGDDPLGPFDIPLSDQWTKVSFTFTPKEYPGGLGHLLFAHQGPGSVYVDNLRLYLASRPYGDFHPVTLQRLNESDMRFMRTHELIKTKWGYTLSGMIGDVGQNNYMGSRTRKTTFFSLLDQMKKAGNISPWLQIEMSLSEEEWIGFVEWMCAPYNPKKDSPKTKPWAYRRYAMGQEKPWIDEFNEFGFEISNETWNRSFAPYDWDWGLPIRDGATGAQYTYGATYGLFNEYVIEQLRKSPYWTDEVEAKTKYMLCGWTAAQLFGADAKRHSPSADIITYASYQHNDWGLGDPKVINDFKRFYWMQWGLSAITPQTAKAVETEQMLAAEGVDVESGVYEFGPAYHVGPGNPKEAIEVDAHLARGMVAAIFCLDGTLVRARNGFTDQAFFTFGHKTGTWGSHTSIPFGGYPYPYWKAFQLYNRHGAGKFMDVELASAPRWDFPAYDTEDNMHKVRRAALPDAPLISVYASQNDDRVTVFLISRKIDNFPVTGDDGYTPASIELPFSKAKKITCYKMVGDPRVDDRFEENTKVETVEISPRSFNGTLTVDRSTGGDAKGLPPASIFVYAFEGADIGDINDTPVALFNVVGPAVVGKPLPLNNKTEDADGDTLSYAWTFGKAGTSDEAEPDFVFPEGGIHKVALTVTDPDGATSSIGRDLPVGVNVGGDRWMPLVQNAHRGAREIKAGRDGDTIVFSGNGAFNSPTYAVLAGDAMYRKDFQLKGVVESVEGQSGGGGLVLVAYRRGGLGFSHEDKKNFATMAGVLVGVDGSVMKLAGERSNPETVLPAGTVKGPVELGIVCKQGVAATAAKIDGQWREIDRVEGLDFEGLIPCVAAGVDKGGPATTVKVSDLQVIQ